MHLVGSPGMSSDDKVIKSMDAFEGQEVVITEKMDGENSTLYCDYYHARSVDSKHHSSRDWLKRFHAEIGFNIPAEYRVCGENMFAKHSIGYENLKSYFYGFSVWSNNPNVCLEWDFTMEMFELLGIVPVPVLYRGTYDPNVLTEIIAGLDTTKQEGVVMRLTRAIPYERFNTEVCKWVRKGHVQTDEHWMHSELIPNKLIS
jgi:hypothetical protein